MLKDRLVLINKEIAAKKTECGKLYFSLMTDVENVSLRKEYDGKKEILNNLMSDMMIVEQMIKDGHN